MGKTQCSISTKTSSSYSDHLACLKHLVPYSTSSLHVDVVETQYVYIIMKHIAQRPYLQACSWSRQVSLPEMRLTEGDVEKDSTAIP